MVERSREIIPVTVSEESLRSRPRLEAPVLDNLKRPLEFTVSRLPDFICIGGANIPVHSLCFVTWAFLRCPFTQKFHKIAPTGSIWISIIPGRTGCPLHGLVARVIASNCESFEAPSYRQPTSRGGNPYESFSSPLFSRFFDTTDNSG